MFQLFKKAFHRPSAEPRDSQAGAGSGAEGPVSQWAATQGLVFSSAAGGSVALDGRVQGKRWRMERGRPTRDYIVGEELRARAKLDLPQDVAAMVMNRSLADRLEHKVFERSTDDLQTAIDNSLPPEVRWLAMYEETIWPSLPEAFWMRYSVHSDRPDLANGWITPELAQLMMEWPQPGPSAEVPFMLLLMQGKAYLRMEYRPADLPTLQHAARVFTSACDAALRSPVDLAL